MPKRTDKHRRADRGVQNVRAAFVNAGWACEEVTSDYGEDLIAQTSLNDIVDPHRILAQVKTTAKAPQKKAGAYTLRVKKEHLRKWVRNPDHFELVMWIEELNEGFWIYPASQFTTWELDHLTAKSIELEIPEYQRLDADGLLKIEWQARINNWNKCLLEYNSNLSYLDIEDFDAKSEYEKHRYSGRREVMGICIDFLSAIGLLRGEPSGCELGPAYIDVYTKIIKEAQSNNKDIEQIGLDAIESSLLFILFRTLEIAPGVGVPSELLDFLF